MRIRGDLISDESLTIECLVEVPEQEFVEESGSDLGTCKGVS
jgi:hypothetical protein